MSMVRDMPTMFVTGNGESGFDSGEGAWETATTSKEDSRRATYPLPARGGSDEHVYTYRRPSLLTYQYLELLVLQTSQGVATRKYVYT